MWSQGPNIQESIKTSANGQKTNTLVPTSQTTPSRAWVTSCHSSRDTSAREERTRTLSVCFSRSVSYSASVVFIKKKPASTRTRLTMVPIFITFVSAHSASSHENDNWGVGQQLEATKTLKRSSYRLARPTVAACARFAYDSIYERSRRAHAHTKRLFPAFIYCAQSVPTHKRRARCRRAADGKYSAGKAPTALHDSQPPHERHAVIWTEIQAPEKSTHIHCAFVFRAQWTILLLRNNQSLPKLLR